MKRKALYVILFLVTLVTCAAWVKANLRPFRLLDSMDKDTPDYVAYEKFKLKYQEKDQIFLILELREQLFNHPEALGVLSRVQGHLQKRFPHWKMHSLLNAQHLYSDDSGHLVFDSMKKLLEQRVSLPQLKMFVSQDLTSTLIRATDFKDTDIKTLRTILKTEALPEGTLHQIGHPVFQEDVRETSIKDQTTIVPLLILTLALFLFFCFRSLSTVLVCLAITTLNYSLTAVFAVWLEGSISPFGSLAMLLGFIMTITDITHILMEDETNQSFWPSFYSTGTTMAAMASLTFSPIMAIRNFGWMGIIATLTGFVLSFYWLPRTMKVFEISPQISPLFGQVTKPLYQFVHRWKLPLLVGFGIFYGATLAFTHQPPIDEKMASQFSDDSSFSKAIHTLKERFRFEGDLELIYTPLTTKVGDLRAWYEMDKTIATQLDSIGNTEGVRSLSRIFSQQTISDSLLSEMDQLGVLKQFKPYFYNEGRITLLLKDSSYATMAETVEQIELKLSPLKASIASYHLTGYSYLRFKTFQKLANTLSNSLLWSALGIFLCIFVMLKSVKLSLLALIPNLLPLLTIQFAFALTGYSMSFYLVMMSVIIIGISDNDTIHYFYQYKTRTTEPIESILQRVAPPTIVLNVAFIISFSFLILSGFKPFREVALGSILTFVVALLSDLLLTTAVLIMTRKPPNHAQC